jgi:hypothetical protein
MLSRAPCALCLFSRTAVSPPSCAHASSRLGRPLLLERGRHVLALPRSCLRHFVVASRQLPRREIVLAREALGVVFEAPGARLARLLGALGDKGRQLQRALAAPSLPLLASRRTSLDLVPSGKT